MNARIVKKETVTCTNCGHTILLNAWGIPKVSRFEGAMERALEKLKNEMGFGIKEEHETNKKRSNGSKEEGKKGRGKKLKWEN